MYLVRITQGSTKIPQTETIRILQYFLKYAYKLGVDAIRLYTLWPPAFYDTLADFNTNRDRPLYILQGIYPPETSLLTTEGIGINAFSTVSSVKREIEYVVNATLGNFTVPSRPGIF